MPLAFRNHRFASPQAPWLSHESPISYTTFFNAWARRYAPLPTLGSLFWQMYSRYLYLDSKSLSRRSMASLTCGPKSPGLIFVTPTTCGSPCNSRGALPDISIMH